MMIGKKARCAAVLSFLMLAPLFAHAGRIVKPNLVENGAFLNPKGSLEGWDQGGDTSYTGVCGGTCARTMKGYSAYMGPIGTGTLGQTVATVAGDEYYLTFALAQGGAGPNSFSVDLGGTTVFSLSNIGYSGYTRYRFFVVASSSNVPLTFSFSNPASYWYMANVALYLVEPAPAHSNVASIAAVPEPGSLALLLGGGFAVVGSLRKRFLP